MQFTKSVPLVITFSFLCQMHVVFAQSSEEDDLALIYGDTSTASIATGSQQSLRRAPAVATVITAEDIAAMGATDLDQVMETVPGVHVTRNQIANAPNYMFRGIYDQFNSQVLMLQNGIPVTTLQNSDKGNIWGGLPLENIARIEIIRGPGSALYGADAYAGVINLITKSAADIQGAQVGFRVGSFNTWDTWAQYGGKLGPVDMAAYLSVGGANGYSGTVVQDAQTRNDALFHTKASLAPGSINTGYHPIDGNLDLAYDKWRLRASYKLRDDLGTGAGVASALDPVGKGMSQRITSDLSWIDPQFARDWGGGATMSIMQYTQQADTSYQLFPSKMCFPTGCFPNGVIASPDAWERQARLSAYATYSGFTDHRVRFGVGHDDLDMYRTAEYRNFTYTRTGIPVPLAAVMDFSNSTVFLQPHDRRIDYLYAQDEWQLTHDLAVTAGVRHDNYSDFGGTTNPRLAVVWDARYDLTAKLLAGRAFRAPSFAEEYSVNNPVQIGNPNLLPETIGTVEAAFAWQATQDLQVNLNFFRLEMSNIIRVVPNVVAGAGNIFENTGKESGKGMELEAIWDATRDVRLSGNYAFQHMIDDATNTDAGYAPHQHIYVRGDWRFVNNWLGSLQINHVADRERAYGDSRAPVPNYTTVDLAIRTNRGKDHWDFSGGVRNLFNANALEPTLAPGLALPFDLPIDPRTLFVQAIYKL